VAFGVPVLEDTLDPNGFAKPSGTGPAGSFFEPKMLDAIDAIRDAGASAPCSGTACSGTDCSEATRGVLLVPASAAPDAELPSTDDITADDITVDRKGTDFMSPE